MIRRLLLAAALAGAVPAVAQTPLQRPRLTLGEALRRADQAAYANRGARAAADAQRASARAALRGVLPAIGADASLLRTTDPINAFGFSLKQRGVSMASFNPATLNDPSAISNYAAGLTLQQPLLNGDAWAGLRAARAAASATEAQATWATITTRQQVVLAFYGAVVAQEMAATMRAADRAAREHVRAAELAAGNGLVTKSDALLARVRAGEVEAQRIEAESRAQLARAQLALVLGTPDDSAFTLPDSLPLAADVAPMHGEVTTRADVQAATLARDAARFDRQRAGSSMLPRLNSFARYEWNSPARVAAGKPMWTVGAMLSWSPFGGGAELADLQGAAARLRGAEAQAEGARAAAALQRRDADASWRVAAARAAIADTAVRQSDEALRIVRRKYEGGLAAISELLDAAAANTQAYLMRSDARYKLISAAAARLTAWGGDPATLASLDTDNR
ncbi:MAG: TolC family protein [Gemmatimonadaceae bacterium]|nr:TolC family protein [Gemmatimonadaceae bacterium]